jgi:hypothetical protein
VGAWGNSGVWDNTPIVNNGSISAKVNSPQDKTEQMIGLSYKTSEAKAQNMSYNLIDYAWYFRFSDGLAYVRVNNINNSSYTALDVDIWCGKVGIVGLPSIYWYLISVVNTEAS